uniref:endo-polygalacturonase n=1 Tax=Moniliophthora roreri TaxID=221103 RepID=A0A0W0GC44_MONRR
MHSLLAVTAASYVGLTFASPLSSRCTGTIASLDDVAEAVKCTEVNIESFEVPAGQALEINLLDGSTVNMNGDVTFGVANWEGPLFTVSGNDITFNGNGHKFDGNGPEYWDGLGGNGGVTKPAPMMKSVVASSELSQTPIDLYRIKISGVYQDVIVVNSPARTYSVSNPGPLLMTSLTIDNSLGDEPNDQSNGEPAGHNTDGFDCSTQDLVISNSVIHNQDDCLAINKGSNITFTGNTCTGGHGISVGSISSDAVVTDIHITNNMVIDNDQALRIKTKANATSASVSGVTYSGNTATGCKRFGVIIDQSYPDTLGEPGDGVTISDITFSGETSDISVGNDAQRVAVNCGSGSCTGTWDWSALKVCGGEASTIEGFNGITGWSDS